MDYDLKLPAVEYHVLGGKNNEFYERHDDAGGHSDGRLYVQRNMLPVWRAQVARFVLESVEEGGSDGTAVPVDDSNDIGCC